MISEPVDFGSRRRELVKGGLIGLSLFLVWILPSSIALLADQPSIFQRLGACGIVWAVVFFTFSRKALSDFQVAVYNQDLQDTARNVLIESERVLAELSMLREQTLEHEKPNGQTDAPDENRLTDDRGETSALREEVSEIVSKARRSVRAFPQGRRLIFGLLFLEAFVFCTGTLQSGFGDWFVCSMNSWRLSTCSS